MELQSASPLLHPAIDQESMGGSEASSGLVGQRLSKKIRSGGVYFPTAKGGRGLVCSDRNGGLTISFAERFQTSRT